ncbi:MAG: pyrroline-5-carboxylate reductase [Oscillospiraceae bacterium]|nr:pyrroline-5-carboxylate reductase [Oscillospiraceae bacterium]
MEKIFGFIGAGNMGGALARSAARTVPGKQILIANRTAAKAEALAAELGACASDNITAAQRADYIILGVKPQMFPELTAELAPVLAARQSPFVLVTMAAGITIERLRALLHGDWPVIRIMPNTPCSVGRGVILYTAEGVEDADVRAFLAAMDGAGELIELPETLFDAGSAVSGCGPAFVDLFIEAMADGGVACGLPRAAALRLAARTAEGAAALLLGSGRHPGELKDAVCSPGGTTIQGVRALENAAFRGAVIEAVIAAWAKNRDLG